MIGYSLVHILIVLIIVAACIGIATVAMRQAGFSLPPFVVQILWIVGCAALAIIAIRFVVSL